MKINWRQNSLLQESLIFSANSQVVAEIVRHKLYMIILLQSLSILLQQLYRAHYSVHMYKYNIPICTT